MERVLRTEPWQVQHFEVLRDEKETAKEVHKSGQREQEENQEWVVSWETRKKGFQEGRKYQLGQIILIEQEVRGDFTIGVSNWEVLGDLNKN